MYKIEEIEDGKFKLFKKVWFFWVGLAENTYAGDTYMIFDSLHEAQTGLAKYVMAKQLKATNDALFKQRSKVYTYDSDDTVIRTSSDGKAA